MPKLTRATKDIQMQSRTEKLRPFGQLVRKGVTGGGKKMSKGGRR